MYDKEDVCGTKPEYKEGRLCSPTTYMVRLFSYKKKEGSAETKDKADKTIDHLASLTGTLPGYDKSTFSKRVTWTS